MKDAKYTEKADVYSFGILMWELLARKVPFGDMKLFKVAKAVIEGIRPPIPPDANKEYPKYSIGDKGDCIIEIKVSSVAHTLYNPSVPFIVNDNTRRYTATMEFCWQDNYEQRPSFERLEVMFDIMIQDTKKSTALDTTKL